MDPVTQALLLSNTPIKVLKSMEEHLRKKRSPERLKSALGEKGARNYTQLQTRILLRVRRVQMRRSSLYMKPLRALPKTSPHSS